MDNEIIRLRGEVAALKMVVQILAIAAVNEIDRRAPGTSEGMIREMYSARFQVTNPGSDPAHAAAAAEVAASALADFCDEIIARRLG